MKRLILIFLSIILCAAIVGCGGNSTAGTDNTTSSGQNETSSETTEKDMPEGTRESRNGFDESSNKEVVFKGCSIAIPEYYGENQSENEDGLLFYVDQGQGKSLLTVESVDYSRTEEDFKKEENAIIMRVLEVASNGIDIDLDKSDIENRHFVGSFDTDGETTNLELEIKPLYMGDRVFILNFVQTSGSPYDYFSDFAKVADSVKRLEG